MAFFIPKRNAFTEIECLRKMRHPNIIALLGVVLTADFNLLVITELCEQKNLSVFFSKFRQKAPVDVKIKILFDVAKALYYLHGKDP